MSCSKLTRDNVNRETMPYGISASQRIGVTFRRVDARKLVNKERVRKFEVNWLEERKTLHDLRSISWLTQSGPSMGHISK